jgi:predicted nucleic acid-binding protein
MIIVDASAIVELLLQTNLGKRVGLRLFSSRTEACAPELLQVEVLQVLRRYRLSNELSEIRAAEALQDFHDLPILYYPHRPLLKRIWQLHQNFSAYDAAYLALAEAIGDELLTADRALKNSKLHKARVRVLE